MLHTVSHRAKRTTILTITPPPPPPPPPPPNNGKAKSKSVQGNLRRNFQNDLTKLRGIHFFDTNRTPHNGRTRANQCQITLILVNAWPCNLIISIRPPCYLDTYAPINMIKEILIFNITRSFLVGLSTVIF